MIRLLFKPGFIALLLCGPAVSSAYLFWDDLSGKEIAPYTTRVIKTKQGTFEKLQLKADTAKQFAKKNNYNTNTCFLFDISLPSGQKRFFIYDLQKDTIKSKGLVAHGNCFEYWLEGRRYSNATGSGCSSPGKYKIGSPYTGKFGYSYKLYGLDSSNSNAFERTVVLHSHSCVPENETDDEICQSNGCPTVAFPFLQLLKTIINGSGKPVLLWIYE